MHMLILTFPKYSTMYSPVLFCIILSTLLLPLSAEWPPMSGMVYLDSQQEFKLNWTYNVEEKLMNFFIEAKTTGYAGLGIVRPEDPNFTDVFLGGEDCFVDGHIIGDGPIIPDVQIDWNFRALTYDDSTIRIWVQRLSNTCDDEDVPLTSETMTFVYLIGTTNDCSSREGEKRGSKLINLQSYNVDDDYTGFHTWSPTLDVILNPYPTTRWCSIHEWVNPDPNPSTKHHFVGFEPLLNDDGAKKHAQRIYLHQCTPPNGEDSEAFFGKYVGKNGDCTNAVELPFGQCLGNYVYAWAAGGEPMTLPDNVGVPVSAQGAAKVYFALEVHFDFESVFDDYDVSVGILAYHTNQTREQEAGLLRIKRTSDATLVDITVPPRSTDFVLAAHCRHECTEAHFPEDGLTVFHNLFEAHILGRKMKLRQFRGNTELPWLDKDDDQHHFYMQNRPLPLTKVERGDQITLECRYDNSKNITSVTGGHSKYEEACSALLWYYPRMPNPLLCGSEHLLDNHLSLFGITNHTLKTPPYPGGPLKVDITAPSDLAGDYLNSLNNKFSWTPSFLETYQNEKWMGEQMGFCFSSVSGVSGPVSYPDNLTAYIPPMDTCNNWDNADWPPTAGNAFLDSAQEYSMFWTTNPYVDSVEFFIYAKTTGYVGLGVQSLEDPGFVDLFVGGVLPNASQYWIDGHSIKNGPLIPDKDSSWFFRASIYNPDDGTTLLWVQRKFDTCDAEGDVPITKDTMKFVYVMGVTDDYNNRNGERRGIKEINLYSYGHTDFNSTGTHTWSPTVEVRLPTLPTSRWCSLHEWVNPASDPQTKHHFTRFEPLWRNAVGKERTQRMYLQRCIPPEGEDAEAYFGRFVGRNGDCNDAQIFPFERCSGNYVYAWSSGGEPMILPDNVGIPVSEDGTANAYFALEAHFNFESEQDDYNVNVGILAYYTNETRDLEAGVMTVKRTLDSSLVDITIPPYSYDFALSAHCRSECTQEYLPPNGVTVFHNLFETHKLGHSMQLRQFRGNRELPWLDKDDNHNYLYSQNRPVKFTKVARGDQITLECRYNFSIIPVTGGYSNYEEACGALLWYFPKMSDQLLCGSEQDLGKHLGLFGVTDYALKQAAYPGGPLKVDIRAPSYLSGDYLYSLTNEFNWTAEFLGVYHNEKLFGEQTGFCVSKASDPVPPGPVTYPSNFLPYIPPNPCDSLPNTTTTTTAKPRHSGGKMNSFDFLSVCLTTGILLLVR